jgi:hypothetical protein
MPTATLDNTNQATLEVPLTHGFEPLFRSALKGVSFISGVFCTADSVTITVDGKHILNLIEQSKGLAPEDALVYAMTKLRRAAHSGSVAQVLQAARDIAVGELAASMTPGHLVIDETVACDPHHGELLATELRLHDFICSATAEPVNAGIRVSATAWLGAVASKYEEKGPEAYMAAADTARSAIRHLASEIREGNIETVRSAATVISWMC